MSFENISPEEPNERPDLDLTVFNDLANFDKAYDPEERRADMTLDLLNRINRRDELVENGMTAEQALEFIELVEGVKTKPEQNIALEHEFLSLSHQGSLDNLGLEVGNNLTVGAHVSVKDGQKLSASLADIAPEQATVEFQDGLKNMLTNFSKHLPVKVINDNPTDPRISDNRLEIYLKTETVDQTLDHGNAIAEQCERLGVDSKEVEKLRRLADYKEEGTLTEWALMSSLDLYDDPHDPNGALRYRRVEPEEVPVVSCLASAQLKTGPDGRFVNESRDIFTENLNAQLRAQAANKMVLTTEEDNEIWPDKAAAEREIAQLAESDEDLQKLLNLRNDLQQFGKH